MYIYAGNSEEMKKHFPEHPRSTNYKTSHNQDSQEWQALIFRKYFFP